MTNGVHPGAEPVKVKTIDTALDREYVSGGGSALGRFGQAIRALPTPVDDVDKRYGDDVYRIMLRSDPVVASCINTLKTSILEDGCIFSPAITDEEDPSYTQAEEIHGFVCSVMDALPIPLIDVLWNMLDALCYGSKVAELTFRQDGAHLVLTSIKVKPRKATAFVVDAFYNVLGLVGTDRSMPGSLVVTTDSTPTLLPRDKFAVLTIRPRDNDPRGTSILRPAYLAYYFKVKTIDDFYRYLMQFASPIPWGTTAQGARAGVGETQTPQELLLEQLVNLRNGSAAALPYGTELNLLASTGEGMAFHRAFDLFNREMVMGILHQTRATMEAEHGSKADSQTGQDVLDTLVRQIKASVVRMVHRDILVPLVRYNYGDAAVALCPALSLGSVEEQDRTAMWTALAALVSSGYPDPSQYPELDLKIGFPVRMVTTPDDTTAVVDEEA